MTVQSIEPEATRVPGRLSATDTADLPPPSPPPPPALAHRLAPRRRIADARYRMPTPPHT